MTEVACVFECRGCELVGVLHAPGAKADWGVVFVVGGAQYRVGSHRLFVRLARDIARLGGYAFRFDCRGMGDSGGEHPGFVALDTDIAAAIAEVRRRAPDVRRFVLLGLCDSAYAGALYAAADRDVVGLVALNPWVEEEGTREEAIVAQHYPARLRTGEFWRRLMTGRVRIWSALWMIVLYFARRLAAGRGGHGGVTLSDQLGTAMGIFSGQVLVVLSEEDLTADAFRHASGRPGRLHDAIVANGVTIETVADADHTFSTPGSADALVGLITAWLGTTVARP